MTGLFLIFIAFVVYVAGCVWRGYVLSVVWTWFMVPAFGLPVLSVAMAIGVALVVGAVICPPAGMKDDEDITGLFISAIISPLFVLFCGWIVHSVM